MKTLFIPPMRDVLHTSADRNELDKEAARLRAMGYQVINPNEWVAMDATLTDDVKAMLGCDTVVLIDRLPESRHVHTQVDMARHLGMNITYSKHVQPRKEKS